ncbi:hypothetical protein ACLB2K_059055 [Fragaria x ananassa]
MIRSRHEINDPFVVDEVLSHRVAARNLFLYFPQVKMLSYRSRFIQRICECLSRMGVPEDEHPKICEKIFKVVDVAVCSELTVEVLCVDVTDRTLLRTADEVHDMVTRESMETYRPNFIPATKSSIEGLKIVTFEDGLELEAVTTLTPKCVICMKSLEPRRRRGRHGGGIKKKKKKKRSMMISLTCLPCFHHFHADCIAKWLDISHLCPMCRYSMPTAEVGEPSKPQP